jgi:hypothetical protein
MSFVIATFYHFVELSNYYDMKDEIKAACDDVELKGLYSLQRRASTQPYPVEETQLIKHLILYVLIVG